MLLPLQDVDLWQLKASNLLPRHNVYGYQSGKYPGVYLPFGNT